MKLLLALLVCTGLVIASPVSSEWRRSVKPRHTFSPNSISLKRTAGPSSHAPRRRQYVPFTANEVSGSYYALPLYIGSQEVLLNVDTGSKDVWVVDPGFHCYTDFVSLYDFTGERNQDECGFSTAYQPDSDFVFLEDRYLASGYGAGDVTGKYGTAPISFAGVTFEAQIGLADKTTLVNNGDRIMGGLLGLPFGATSDSRNGGYELFKYTTFTESMYAANGDNPQYFSFALSRDDSGSGYGGVFTLGGIPDLTDPRVNIPSNNPTVLDVNDADWEGMWIIDLEGWSLGGEDFYPGTTRALVDSGSPGMTLPPNVKAKLDSLWSEPIDSEGTLSCDAELTGPFSVKLNGTIFEITGRDMMYPRGDGRCWPAVYEQTGANKEVLGLPFLKNVLAAFNHADSEIAFWARTTYES